MARPWFATRIPLLDRRIRGSLASLFALLVIIPAQADQYGAGGVIARFDFDCTATSSMPGELLRSAIAEAMGQSAVHGAKRWADRAYTHDLNRDGQGEYFVPLDCGATGNCTWAVVATSPVRVLAKISGARIYILRALDAGPWEVLVTYTASGAGEGHVAEYGHNCTGAYVPLHEQAVSAVVNDAFLIAMGDPKCEE